jgi:adenylate kinase
MHGVYAILLVGPTGSGKTPLGRSLERKGLWGRRCAHFDFGANLRAVVGEEGQNRAGLTPAELGTVAECLQSGRLLTDMEFSIAEKILKEFYIRKRAGRADLLVILNGMPRHAGQARSIAHFMDIITVVNLVCSARTVLRRIKVNTGGDRKGRIDDALAQIREKLKIFAEKTAPLLDHYRRKGVRILPVHVRSTTSADNIRHILELQGWVDR